MRNHIALLRAERAEVRRLLDKIGTTHPSETNGDDTEARHFAELSDRFTLIDLAIKEWEAAEKRVL